MSWDLVIIFAAVFFPSFLFKYCKSSNWKNSLVFSFGTTIIFIGILQIYILYIIQGLAQLSQYQGISYFEKVSSVFGLPLALFGIGLSMIYQIDNIEKNEREVIKIYSHDPYEFYNNYSERLSILKQEINFFKK